MLTVASPMPLDRVPNRSHNQIRHAAKSGSLRGGTLPRFEIFRRARYCHPTPKVRKQLLEEQSKWRILVRAVARTTKKRGLSWTKICQPISRSKR
jgi:hypothetical protein